jgi:hypothetical protein
VPFLEILTRVYKRPTMLANNRESLARQTLQDFRQTLLIDEEGQGVGWSYENMAAYAPELMGEYIWILDDDDECIVPDLVAQLRHIAIRQGPEVIMLRMDHGRLGILPRMYWQQEPRQGDIGCSAYVVRRDLWQAHAPAMCPGHYASDFDFISAIFASRPSIVWHDLVASRVQRISHGRPE